MNDEYHQDAVPKYQPLEVAADLSLVSLLAAFEKTPQFHLHVHPHQMGLAHRIVSHPDLANEPIQVVEDHSLSPQEWYIVVAVGSNPTF